MAAQSQTSGNPSAPNAKAAGQRTPGWWIPWIYVGLIVLVAIVNGIMIYFAVTTNSGLETDDAYRKGIKYNQMIAGARAQEERGWKVDFDFAATDKQKGRVTLALRDKEGNLLRDVTVNLKAVRPVVQGHDMPVGMDYLGEGRYGADVAFDMPGVWDLKLIVDHSTGDYQEIKRIWVK